MPFLISSPLGLAPKANGDLHCIHHLFYLQGQFVNNFIPREAVYLKYATFSNIFSHICRVKQEAIIIKKDIKVVFCNISVVSHQQWLLCFQ